MNDFVFDDDESRQITLFCDSDSERLDSFCASRTDLTRSHIEKLCDLGLVLVGSVPKKKNYRLKNGDTITLTIPPAEELDAVPQDIPLDVVYEDGDLIVVNKPAGMVVHPAPGNPDSTLVNALLYHCSNSLSGINGTVRPGIVHRLDKDTSGLLICAKTDRAHIKLAADIKEHKIEKIYYALVYGHPKLSEGTVDLAVGRSRTDRKKMCAYPTDTQGAKKAVTHYKVEKEFDCYSLLRISLETGRTHQIRVHLLSIGHPVVGDTLYAAGRETLGLKGQCLHAAELTFYHPVTGEKLHFVSPLPSHFQEALRKAEGKKR
ncbi:MAG: RluA family pseudouridine synthase [Clostridia bacterium]|nr:RluA family pseudouridine synthase [Clostridia bacterium]